VGGLTVVGVEDLAFLADAGTGFGHGCACGADVLGCGGICVGCFAGRLVDVKVAEI
jgi:hypothetical protein